MTLETFAIIICAVLGGISYIGIKHLEKHTYVKYKDQKAWGDK
jgi:hypothetical protein